MSPATSSNSPAPNPAANACLAGWASTRRCAPSTRITKGEGREEDLAELDELGRMIRDTSLCGLGQSAPNPILTTMRHFRHEFEDHIRAKRCRAGVCQDLALSPCENSCPLHMNIPRFLRTLQGRTAGRRLRVGHHGQSAAGFHRPRLPASVRQPLPAPGRRRTGEHARSASRHRRFHSAIGSLRRDGQPRSLPQAPAHRAESPWSAAARRA